MKSLEDARRIVFDSISRLPSESVDLGAARGRVLFADVYAAEDVPHFDNSAMDGFAVRGEDVQEPGARLQIVGESRAGSGEVGDVGPLTAIKIMTGAPMPAGADTVVKVEDTSSSDSRVEVRTSVATGTSVRKAGGDVKAGDLVMKAGRRLDAADIGVLATVGVGTIQVSRRPRVAVVSTGDELVPVTGPALKPGQIRDSNRPMMIELLSDAGAEVVDLGLVRDEMAVLREALESVSDDADVIVTSGGVSMGDHDVTKLLLKDSGSVGFWKIAMQPGKPFAFGHFGKPLFFGLPGNPVSVLISFEQMLRPALLEMQGATFQLRPQYPGVAGEDWETDPLKTVFMRVMVTPGSDGLVAVRSGGQSSNVLSAAAKATAFAVIPVGVGKVETGDQVTLELFKSPEARRIEFV